MKENFEKISERKFLIDAKIGMALFKFNNQF
jgi:hypothetical protein